MRRSTIGFSVLGGSVAGYFLWSNRFELKEKLRSKIKSKLPFPLNKRVVRRAIIKVENFLDPEYEEKMPVFKPLRTGEYI